MMEHLSQKHPANLRQVTDCAGLLAGLLAVVHASFTVEHEATVAEWKRQQLDAIGRVEFNEIGKHLQLKPVPLQPHDSEDKASNLASS